MSFSLSNDWDKIQTSNSFNTFPSQWKYKWGIHPINAQMMYNALIIHKPSSIVETGTFEGHGVYVMAKALSDTNTPCTIHTIDYDGDPLTAEDAAAWKELREIRNSNLERIHSLFPLVTINFYDGDSREVLPALIQKGLTWDFFFQDSMHFLDGITKEWEIMESAANPNAIVVFDDISLSDNLKHPDAPVFCNQFINSIYGQKWCYKSTDIGHRQFWAQKK